jgi:glycosyltransferase involved in cell wall biosynthesis
MALKQKKARMKTRKIVWIGNIPDHYLHKMAKIEILKPLAKKGHDVSLIVPLSSIKYQIENSKIKVISIPLKSLRVISQIMFDVMLLFFLPIYILTSKPDFIITAPDGTIFGFLSTVLFKRLGFKLVLDIRSTPVETVGLRGFMKIFRFNATVSVAKKMFDGITIITLLMKKEVCERFTIDPSKVGVWTEGVSTTLFKYDRYTHQRKILRERLGLSNKFVVLYHGAFTPTRGLIECIKAMSLVKQRCSNVVLFLLGTGPIINDLKKLIQEEKVHDNVIIHSAVDYKDVPKYIAMGDIGIVPLPNISYWKHQCPLKLLEYLAMKKAVIITDIPAHRNIVENKKCGIFISSTNPEEIAKAILHAYENRDELEKWGAAGREIVVKKYTWEKTAKDLENFLLSLQTKRARSL